MMQTLTDSKQPHYRMTLEAAKQAYKQGLITATGLVYYAVKTTRKDGYKLRVKEIDSFCADLGIKRPTYYKCLSKLKVQGLMNWEVIGQMDLWVVPESDSNLAHLRPDKAETESEQEHSTNVECLSTIVETLSTNVECLSTIVDKECSNALLEGDSGNPSIILSNFSQSLSHKEEPEAKERERERELEKLKPKPKVEKLTREESLDPISNLPEPEREEFVKFAESRADALPKTPVMIESWIAANFTELYKQFKKSPEHRQAKKKAAIETYDWRSDARFDVWIWEAFNRGYQWINEVEAEREQRHNFSQWARHTNAYEGVCY